MRRGVEWILSPYLSPFDSILQSRRGGEGREVKIKVNSS
jgi:hypothetical protein